MKTLTQLNEDFKISQNIKIKRKKPLMVKVVAVVSDEKTKVQQSVHDVIDPEQYAGLVFVPCPKNGFVEDEYWGVLYCNCSPFKSVVWKTTDDIDNSLKYDVNWEHIGEFTFKWNRGFNRGTKSCTVDVYTGECVYDNLKTFIDDEDTAFYKNTRFNSNTTMKQFVEWLVANDCVDTNRSLLEKIK